MEKTRAKLWNGSGSSAGWRGKSRWGIRFCLYPDFYGCPQRPKRNHLAKLEYFFTLLPNFHPLNCCKVLEKEESKNYHPPPGQITPTKTSQMFGLPLFVREKIELILYITNIVAAILWPDIFILFLRLLSLQEMKCDFYSLHGNNLYEGRGLSRGNAWPHITWCKCKNHSLSQGQQHHDTGPCVRHTTQKVGHMPFPFLFNFIFSCQLPELLSGSSARFYFFI